MGDESPAQVYDEILSGGAAALCGGGEEQFDVHTTHGEVARTVLAGAFEGRRVLVLPADAEGQLEQLIQGVEDGSQAVAVWQLLLAWRVPGVAEGGSRPSWDDLTEGDRARVVVYLRTAVDEGLEYAWEHYRPGFSVRSPLHGVSSGEELRRLYGAEFVDLSDQEFSRLYDLGMAQ